MRPRKREEPFLVSLRREEINQNNMKKPKLLTTKLSHAGPKTNNSLLILVSLNRDPALAGAPR